MYQHTEYMHDADNTVSLPIRSCSRTPRCFTTHPLAHVLTHTLITTAIIYELQPGSIGSVVVGYNSSQPDLGLIAIIVPPPEYVLHTNRGYVPSMDRDPIHGSNVSFMEDPNHGWQQISISGDVSSMDGDPIRG
jgi:hypothetical protein